MSLSLLIIWSYWIQKQRSAEWQLTLPLLLCHKSKPVPIPLIQNGGLGIIHANAIFRENQLFILDSPTHSFKMERKSSMGWKLGLG